MQGNDGRREEAKECGAVHESARDRAPNARVGALRAIVAHDEIMPLGNLDRAEVMNVIGDVAGRTCILQDDIIDTAGTIVKAAGALKEAGASRVLGRASAGASRTKKPRWRRASTNPAASSRSRRLRAAARPRASMVGWERVSMGVSVAPGGYL